MIVTDETIAAGPGSAEPEDLVLLGRYANGGDAEAFRILVVRYQNLVWSACRRILRNSPDVEDAVQNVFLAMAKNAAKIDANLAAWLHRTAVNRSTSQVRADAARRNREQRSREVLATGVDETEWSEMRDLIDVCLADLDEADRELIIEHFYRGKTQLEIGKRLGIGQQAVAARLKKTVEQLRWALKTRGLQASVVAISGALSASLAEASAPAHLTAALSKIGISGIGCAKSSWVPGMAKLSKGILVLLPVALCLTATWYFWGRSHSAVADVVAQIDAARSIQYTSSRINSIRVPTEQIEPHDVLDRTVERIQVLDGYLERVDELDHAGNVVRTMIANYRTGAVIWLDPQAKTYTTNVRLKRQQADVPNPAELRNLAPQTDLADFLANFSKGDVETLAGQNSDGKSVASYRVESTPQNSVWRRTLWVDATTGRPLRTLVTFRNSVPGVAASDWMRDDFVFDAQLPRALFSTDPPAGFRLENMSNASAEDGAAAVALP